MKRPKTILTKPNRHKASRRAGFYNVQQDSEHEIPAEFIGIFVQFGWNKVT